jgi:ribose transport system ATP-binding protein
MEQDTKQQGYLLEMRGIKKSFAGVHALKGVDFTLKYGEVHVLIGENGAGKSTMIKSIAGAIMPDEGTILLEGKKVHFESPSEAQFNGIGTVFQEFNLMPHLTVYENIFVANSITVGNRIKLLNRKEMMRRSQEILKSIGVEFDVTDRVVNLGIAQQQMIEIAKALSMNARILILDEPSAVLTENETKNLFKVLRELRNKGIGIIFISHRLEEIYEIGDRITILRDGSFITTIDLHEKMVSMNEIIAYMVGRSLEEKYPKIHMEKGEEIFRVENLTSVSGKRFRNISFSLHKGEVLAFSGLVGAGRTEVAKAIFGAFPKSSGKVWLYGKELYIRNPKDAIKNGISYVTEDRKTEGLFLRLSIRNNMMAVDPLQFAPNGVVLDNKKIKKVCGDMAERLKINTHDLNLAASSLSGGNQQKLSLSKWLIANSKIVLFDEPTRGVDVGAKVEIYNIINELIASGVGVIMISSEMPEILGFADRILVMCEGEITAELDAKTATQEQIMSYATR